jgi:hypothetical protein
VSLLEVAVPLDRDHLYRRGPRKLKFRFDGTITGI